jgi:hypothetical protein
MHSSGRALSTTAPTSICKDVLAVGSDVVAFESGAALWRAMVSASARPTIIQGPYAFCAVVGDGSHLTTARSVLRLGPQGHALPVLQEVLDVLVVRPPFVIVVSDSIEPSEDHFITVQVDVVNLADGTVIADDRFEPDYDANLRVLNPDDSPGFPEPRVRVDANNVFINSWPKLFAASGLRVGWVEVQPAAVE